MCIDVAKVKFKTTLGILTYMYMYRKTSVKRSLSKRHKICFQDQLSLNAGRKYCRMLKGEHSAIISTFIKLPFVIKIFVLSIFEWPFYTGFAIFPHVSSLSNQVLSKSFIIN